MLGPLTMDSLVRWLVESWIFRVTAAPGSSLSFPFFQSYRRRPLGNPLPNDGNKPWEQQPEINEPVTRSAGSWARLPVVQQEARQVTKVHTPWRRSSHRRDSAELNLT